MRDLVIEVVKLIESDDYESARQKMYTGNMPVIRPYMFRVFYKPKEHWELGVDVYFSVEQAKSSVNKNLSENRDDVRAEMVFSHMNLNFPSLSIEIPTEDLLNNDLEFVEIEAHQRMLSLVKTELEKLK